MQVVVKKSYVVKTATGAARKPTPKPTEHAVICFCGSPMRLKWSGKFKHGWFYACTRYPECRGAHGCHADGKPLGIPADDETKKARMAAHKEFDSLWRSGYMSRRNAYGWMQRVMGISSDEAHIAMMTVAQCKELVGHVAVELSKHRKVK